MSMAKRIGGPCRMSGCHDVAGHSGPCPRSYDSTVDSAKLDFSSSGGADIKMGRADLQDQVERLTDDKRRQQEYIAELIDSRGEAWNRRRDWEEGFHRVERERDEANRQLAVVMEAVIIPVTGGRMYCKVCVSWWKQGEKPSHQSDCILADLPAVGEIDGEAAQARYIGAVRKAEEERERAEKLAKALQRIENMTTDYVGTSKAAGEIAKVAQAALREMEGK